MFQKFLCFQNNALPSLCLCFFLSHLHRQALSDVTGASLACLDEAGNTLFPNKKTWCTAWKGAQKPCPSDALSRAARCHHSRDHRHTASILSSDTTSPWHPNTEGILRAHAEHSVERKCGSFVRTEFCPSEDHCGKLTCASGMCPICVTENKLKPPLILIPCQYYSSLHASAFSGLQAAKLTSILICRDGLCRGALRAGSPIALGVAQAPTKPVKSSQPYETPHKRIPDNLDMGNKILQYCCVHLSPAVFWNTFFHKIALAVAIFFSTQRCLLTKHQQCQTHWRVTTAS